MRPGLRAVTFDCWGTLLYERDPGLAFRRRVDILTEVAGAHPEPATRALERAWQRHVALWRDGVASGSQQMALWALEDLGVPTGEKARRERLAGAFADAARGAEVLALDGAVASLERLASSGVRRALVCDTGFSPGRVVRQFLADQGLLELLEVLVFSDEVGVPKPDPRAFEAALGPLATAPEHAVHVGDLRRTDVAGGRGFGMGTVRIRAHYDDQSEHPEADRVVDSHAELLAFLELD